MSKKPFRMRRLDNPHGYVATAAPPWTDTTRNLGYAVDPRALMSMRLLDYQVDARSITAYRDRRKCAWVGSVENAAAQAFSVKTGTRQFYAMENHAREALANLIYTNIVGEWYVAGFSVRAGSGLDILLGFIHSHRLDPDIPCKFYAAVTLSYPISEIHLRFEPRDRRVIKAGQPLFYDVHFTDLPGKENRGCYDAIRVREYYSPQSGKPACYDVCDLLFAGAEAKQVPVVRYKDVQAWPTIRYLN